MRRRVLLFLAAVGVGLVAATAPAGGDAPWRVGWWTASNQGIPQAVAFAPRLSPDNVPDGGFEVGGTTDSPTSYGALLYDLPRGATIGPLLLPLAEGAAPTADPAAAVQACPLNDSQEFKTDDGGPMSDAPPFDCAQAAVGELAADGLAFSFDVAALAGDLTLAIAIVPVESAPVVFAPPGEDSLQVSEGAALLGRSSPGPPRPATAPIPVSPPPTAQVALSPLAPPQVAPAPATPDTAPLVRPADAIASSAPLSSGMGAGSAVVGSVLVAALGAVVALRSRRTLDSIIGAADPTG